MKQILLQQKYPVTTLTLGKRETDCRSIDDILAHFRIRIEGYPAAVFIGIFDHYAHTSGLPDGCIDPGIRDAKNILFCFGREIRDPGVLALRPRSIGAAELEDAFVITFLEAPNPLANILMESWVNELKR